MKCLAFLALVVSGGIVSATPIEAEKREPCACVIIPGECQLFSGQPNAGLIRGSYHFARPDISSGMVQANYCHGGGWSAEASLFPVRLTLNITYGAECYGLSAGVHD